MRKNILSLWTLTIVRIIIGWHFLYEGFVKLTDGTWTAAPYLAGSRWIFSSVFQAIADSNVLMNITDLINVWGLTLIGLALILGIYTRIAAFCGALLMLLYFVAYPPFLGFMQGIVTEGAYLWVNRNLIELVVLLAMGFLPKGMMYGLDHLFVVWNEAKIHKPIPKETDFSLETGGLKTTGVNRRDVLRDLVSLPVLGAFAYALYRKKKFNSWEEKFLNTASASTTDATSGATLLSFEFTSLKNLQAQCPKGKIGNLELSRLIAGGNLIGGWAHSRDLLYVSKLVKAYHSDDKVIQTLSIAEKCGINALLCNPSLARIIHKYWNETDGKIQFISDCQLRMDFVEGAKRSVELKAAAALLRGRDHGQGHSGRQFRRHQRRSGYSTQCRNTCGNWRTSHRIN
ncbi:MAG: DoxX family protein [Bacteroidales bacterium]|nr:DoxX family protein [Bacteroidales bacterium]